MKFGDDEIEYGVEMSSRGARVVLASGIASDGSRRGPTDTSTTDELTDMVLEAIQQGHAAPPAPAQRTALSEW